MGSEAAAADIDIEPACCTHLTTPHMGVPYPSHAPSVPERTSKASVALCQPDDQRCHRGRGQAESGDREQDEQRVADEAWPLTL